MKTRLNTMLLYAVFAGFLFVAACDDDDDPGPQLTGQSRSYDLTPVSDPSISGTVTFAERDDDQVLITIELDGTQAGNSHPAHIHANAAAEGGGIILDLNAVEGATGISETVAGTLNDGTSITFEDLLVLDGHVNVHLSPGSLSTLIAQGDIGGNELNGETKTYTMYPVADPAVSGTATFAERVNGTTLVTIDLDGTQDGVSHPAHIHANTIAEGGGIVIDLNNLDGTTGRSVTNVRAMNDDTPVTYDELLAFNGYINVHTGSTFVVQGDIGENELTGESKTYTLHPVANPAVSGDVTFAERANGTTLVTIALEGTDDGASHPTHIHANTIAEGGPIVINLTNLDGTTGMSRTSVREMNDGTAITYEEMLAFNGYLNVHTGNTFVVQGDIGQNELTGETTEYTLNEVGGSGVTGTAIFAERANGKTQVTLELTGTTAGGNHPAHIHNNDAATGGGIAVDLRNVNGETGRSVTSVHQLNDGTAVTYEELLAFDGHINVHQSPDNLATLIVQGDVGANAP